MKQYTVFGLNLNTKSTTTNLVTSETAEWAIAEISKCYDSKIWIDVLVLEGSHDDARFSE